MADGIKLFLETKDNFPFKDLKFYFDEVRGNYLYFSIPDYINDEDYKILGYDSHGSYEHNDEGVQDLPSEFTAQKLGKANKYEFRDLSDWCKWIILSNLFADRPLLPDNINQDDEDLDELVRLYTEASRKFNSNKDFITLRLTKIFEKFHEKAGKGSTIEEAELDFFKRYYKLIPDEPITKKVRVDVIKQEGESDFIFSTFGITKKFDFNTFKDVIDKKVRDRINAGGSEAFEFAPNKVAKHGSDWMYKHLGQEYHLDTSVGDYLNNRTGYIEIPIKAKVATAAPEAFDRLNAEKINISDLKESEVYTRPTNFDEIFWSDGPGKPNNFFKKDELVKVDSLPDQDGHIEVLRKNLGDLYDPSVEKDKIPFFDGTKGTGTDDVSFCYYLIFIDFIRFDVEENHELTRNIGYYFETVAEQAFEYIFTRLKTVYENTVRTNIALRLGDEKADPDMIKDQDVLGDAEEAGRTSLENIKPGNIGKDETSEEDISNREKKYKQCVLMMNIPLLSKNYREEVVNRFWNSSSPMHSYGLYNGRFTMVRDGNASNQNLIINRLLVPKAERIKSFLNMTPELYAALQPKIRLHKVYYDPSESDGNPHIVREIPFRASTSTQRASLLSAGSTFDKGDGVGIKSFNFSFDGETPATSTKYIKAKLELYFQTFGDFIRERKITDGETEYSFKYVDLFVNTKFCPRMGANEGANTNSPMHYDPSHYRIRADIGYELPGDINSILNRPGSVAGGETKNGEVQEAIKAMNKSFYLNLIDHDINIADDGTVTISADYIAYMEGAAGTKIMNALNSKEARKFEQDQIQIYEEALKNNKCDKKQLSELRASIQGARVIARQKMYQSLTEKLILNGCLYSCFIDKFSRKKFSNEQFFYEKPELVEVSKKQSNREDVETVEGSVGDNKTLEDKWSYITSTYLADKEPQLGTKVNFFYFADLVYFLLDSLYKEEIEFFPEVENIKVVLTSFTLDLLGEETETLINIGEIPVDLDTFIEWFKVEILDKDIEAISIIDFIKRFFLYLIKDVFQETCVNTDQQKRLSFKTMSIMAIDREIPGIDPLHKMAENDMIAKLKSSLSSSRHTASPILDIIPHHSNGTLPLITSAISTTSPKTSDFINYMIIFVHYRPTKFTGLGIKDQDETKGIYHFFVGADKGLIKNINFSKSDIQYIRESRMMNQGTNNLLQLSSVYRSSLKMVGNTLLFPGMELFINPFGFGGPVFGQPQSGPGDINEPNLSNIMGIGGYQQVLKVNSTITPGKFETTVDCIFIHSGEPEEYHESSTGIRTVTNNKQKGLCSVNDPSIDSPSAEDIVACNDLITDVQNALMDYSQTGTIDLKKGGKP